MGLIDAAEDRVDALVSRVDADHGPHSRGARLCRC
jgi:hypothetical protein